MKEIKRSVRFLTDMGANIIRCGGEVSRAEDTVQRIGNALGAIRCDVFAINSYISVCIEDGEGEIEMHSRRIKVRGTDLGRLEELNSLSRGICSGSVSLDRAESIMSAPAQSSPVYFIYAASMAVCSVFTLYFGGGVCDALAAGMAAFITAFLKRRAQGRFGNAVSFTFICSLSCGLVGALLVIFGVAEDYNAVAKGDIMLLVPGISLICAGRDVIEGELITGILGFAETILIAIALAAGFALPELIIHKAEWLL